MRPRHILVLTTLMLTSCFQHPMQDPWQLTATVEPYTKATPEEIREGQRVFVEGSCALCHSIRGTRARASVGPDLTHLASRTTFAGGTLPNTRGQLAGWIMNPQNLKPGVLMPPTVMPAKDLHSLLAFLETLK